MMPALRLMLRLLPAIMAACVLDPGAGMAASGTLATQPAVESIIAEYRADCDAMYKAKPEIDRQRDGGGTEWFRVDEETIYALPLTPDGRQATVVFTYFHCGYFSYAWCGVSGGCKSFLVVDDQVFEWHIVGGRPSSVGNGKTTLIIAPISGYACTDAEGTDGSGANPCFRSIHWDARRETFVSVDGSVERRVDLSGP